MQNREKGEVTISIFYFFIFSFFYFFKKLFFDKFTFSILFRKEVDEDRGIFTSFLLISMRTDEALSGISDYWWNKKWCINPLSSSTIVCIHFIHPWRRMLLAIKWACQYCPSYRGCIGMSFTLISSKLSSFAHSQPMRDNHCIVRTRVRR